MRVSPEGDFDPVYVREGHHGAMMMVVVVMVVVIVNFQWCYLLVALH